MLILWTKLNSNFRQRTDSKTQAVNSGFDISREGLALRAFLIDLKERGAIKRLIFLLPICKPDFVVSYHLSAPSVTRRVQSAYPPARASSPQTLVYVAFQHARFTRHGCYHQRPWALTPRFHLFLASEVVIFCGTFS